MQNPRYRRKSASHWRFRQPSPLRNPFACLILLPLNLVVAALAAIIAVICVAAGALLYAIAIAMETTTAIARAFRKLRPRSQPQDADNRSGDKTR